MTAHRVHFVIYNRFVVIILVVIYSLPLPLLRHDHPGRYIFITIVVVPQGSALNVGTIFEERVV